jgi:hypothetical protein
MWYLAASTKILFQQDDLLAGVKTVHLTHNVPAFVGRPITDRPEIA